MTRGNRARALATIERIAKDNGKPMPLGKLVEPTATVYFKSSNLILKRKKYTASSYFGKIIFVF